MDDVARNADTDRDLFLIFVILAINCLNKKPKGIDMRRHMADRRLQRNKNIVLFFFISLIVLLFTITFTIASQETGKRLIPISILALIAGVLFEGKQISQKWSTLFLITLSSLVLSTLAFLPGKRERHYQFENHIEMWPYLFVIIFAIICLFWHYDKIVPRLTEGITLLQSIAVTYWVIDYGFIDTGSYFLKTLMGIGVMLSLYSVFHAFTYIALTRSGRLVLSLWSSTIMMLFAIDNVYRVYQNEQIENTADISHGGYIALQFFLLGISAIYVIQNLIMLAGFMPSKGRFFNAEYFRDVRQLADQHINRYSEHQVGIGYSLLYAFFTSAAFILNYYYQILPRHVAIWTVFVIFPFFISILYYKTGGDRHRFSDDNPQKSARKTGGGTWSRANSR